MARRLIVGALLVGVGLLVGTYFGTDRRSATDPGTMASAPRAAIERGGEPALPPVGRPEAVPPRRDHRLDAIAAAIASETAAREHIEQRLDDLTEEIAMLRATVQGDAPQASTHTTGVESSAPAAAPSHANPPAAADSTEGLSPTQRALLAAGVDPGVVDRVKRQDDAIQLAQIYLRDQAVREGWADSPRFAEEMQDLKQQYPSLRDEIGDDAYDRYLSALGRPNRVRVEDVMLESPAARAGLQAGDLVLRYGDARIFAPDDLVNETQGGQSGENIRLEVLRQGERIAINVARGPLGIRIAATQGAPEEG